jgi:hypothetical protein
MSKLQNMRGIEIPAFRAVSSGEHTIDEIFVKSLGIAQQQIYLPIIVRNRLRRL